MTIIARWKFRTAAERNSFLFRTFPKRRKMPKLPGIFAIPGGDRVIVTAQEISLFRRKK